MMDTGLADLPDTTTTTTTTTTVTVDSLCQTLLSAVRKTTMDVTAFVRRCRSARTDLAPTTRELSELQMVLELLGDHDHDQSQEEVVGRKEEAATTDTTGTTIPAELQTHLRPILTDCITAVLRIDGVLRQHGGVRSEPGQQQQGGGESGGPTTTQWTAQGRDEVRDLEKALGAYRAVLGLVSDLVSILMVSSSSLSGQKEEEGPHAGGMTLDGLRLPHVLRELQALRTSTLDSPSIAATTKLVGQPLALQVHLGHIIAYAETRAKSEDWDQAERALDEDAVNDRGSIPVPAPLRRICTSTKDAAAAAGGVVGDNFIVLNKGFENLLVRGDDGSRSTTSLLFASHPGTTPNPSKSLMAGGPSTGMMIMDGAGLPGMSGTNAPLQPVHPRRHHVTRRTSGQQQHAMIYTTEKEVAVGRRGPKEEEITEEALAFAQVPVHILGRLSLNLVGHVYTGTTTSATTTSATSPHTLDEPNPGNVSGLSDQTSYVQSLSTMKTEDGGDFDDGASARTSDMGSLHDGDLQFSQLDPSKPPPAALQQPLPPSQTTLGSQTSVGSQQQQQESISRHLIPVLPPAPSSVPSQPLPPPPPPPSSSQQSLPASSSSSATARTPTPATTYLLSHNPQQQYQHQPPPPPSSSSPSMSRIISHPHRQRHERVPSSAQSSVVYGPPPPSSLPPPPQSLREMRSMSTMNTQTFVNMQKPLPRTPLVYIPSYPGPFVKTKAVVVGNFSCGKTCLIT